MRDYDFEPAAFEIEELAGQVLKDWRKNSPRYSGVVTAIDGTTAFITSGERTFLAFIDKSRPAEFLVGDTVEFTQDNLRAVRVVKIEIPA